MNIKLSKPKNSPNTYLMSSPFIIYAIQDLRAGSLFFKKYLLVNNILMPIKNKTSGKYHPSALLNSIILL